MKPHRTDLSSLIPGLAFVALAVAAQAGVLDVDLRLDLRWVWPAVLIGVGIVLLAGIGRDRTPAHVEQAAETPASNLEATDDVGGGDTDLG